MLFVVQTVSRILRSAWGTMRSTDCAPAVLARPATRATASPTPSIRCHPVPRIRRMARLLSVARCVSPLYRSAAFGGTHRPARTAPDGTSRRVPFHALTHRVLERHRPLLDRQQRHVRRRPRAERAQRPVVPDHLGGGARRHGHHLVQGEAEVQELRHGRGQVEHGTLEVVDVEVAGDRPRPEALGQRPAGDLEAERALAVAHVEQHPAGRRPAGRRGHRAPSVEDALLAPVVAVSDHVARAAARPGCRPGGSACLRRGP